MGVYMKVTGEKEQVKDSQIAVLVRKVWGKARLTLSAHPIVMLQWSTGSMCRIDEQLGRLRRMLCRSPRYAAEASRSTSKGRSKEDVD